jgi:hypothetical protein
MRLAKSMFGEEFLRSIAHPVREQSDPQEATFLGETDWGVEKAGICSRRFS